MFLPVGLIDYVRFSKEISPTFHGKFCAVRWLENEPVALTAIKAVPAMQKFLDGVTEAKIKIDSKSFGHMERGLGDKLLCAKLAFFAYITQLLKPF